MGWTCRTLPQSFAPVSEFALAGLTSGGGPGGTIRHPHGQCGASSVLHRCLSKEATQGRLLPSGMVESSGAWDVTNTPEDTMAW